MRPAQSGRASRIAWYQISVAERTLVNTSVDCAPSIARMTSRQQLEADVAGPRKAVDGGRMRGGDLDRLGVQALDDASARRRERRSGRQRLVEIGQRGRQSPHAHRRAAAQRSRASASSTCTPRLLDMSSCHSSTMTADRCARRSRQSARASISVRLSGVVTSAVGSRLFCRARADDAVSPVRTSTVQCGCNARAARASANPVSAASARSGVIHSAVSGGGASAAPAAPSTSGGIHAAYVLPMPVGACSRPLSPRANADQTSSWNGNGDQPCVANHARAGPKASDAGCVAAAGGASPRSASAFTRASRPARTSSGFLRIPAAAPRRKRRGASSRAAPASAATDVRRRP